MDGVNMIKQDYKPIETITPTSYILREISRYLLAAIVIILIGADWWMI